MFRFSSDRTAIKGIGSEKKKQLANTKILQSDAKRELQSVSLLVPFVGCLRKKKEARKLKV